MGALLHLLLTLPFAHAALRELTPETWHAVVGSRRWVVAFTVQGCKHCERLLPMLEAVSMEAPELRFGRVDSTEYNGLARTFGVHRYPTVLLFSEDGSFYEFSGRRSVPLLLSFGRSGEAMGLGKPTPTTLQSNVSDWWLLAEVLWEPLKVALFWSVGIALALKLCAVGMLRLLQRCERAGGGGARASGGRKRRVRKDGDAGGGGSSISRDGDGDGDGTPDTTKED